MCLKTYLRQFEIWHNSNADIPINTMYQDLVESLKINKYVKGLAKYVGKHILLALNTQEYHTVKNVIGCLENYGRTRLDKLEELVDYG